MSKRRANGEGNIRKRPDDCWEGWYVEGHDERGKSIRKNVLGRTQAEVKERPKKAVGQSGNYRLMLSGFLRVCVV